MGITVILLTCSYNGKVRCIKAPMLVDERQPLPVTLWRAQSSSVQMGPEQPRPFADP